MRLWRIALLAFLAGSLPLPASLVVGTWNLQNYLLEIRFPEGRFRPDYPKPEWQKRAIRELLVETRPDVLFLQELGSKAFLLELQLDLAARGLDYPYSGFAAAPDARTGLAFLSRIAPDLQVFHDPLPAGPQADRIPRGLQEVRFTSDGRSWRFYHVHLKSRYSEDPADPDSTRLRGHGLLALGALLNRLVADDPVCYPVLVGDFNTPAGSPLLNPLSQHWQRILPADAEGLRFTYTHRKSGSREILDGFWVRHPGSLLPLALLPGPDQPAPSDHRLVLVRLAGRDPPSPSTARSDN